MIEGELPVSQPQVIPPTQPSMPQINRPTGEPAAAAPGAGLKPKKQHSKSGKASSTEELKTPKELEDSLEYTEKLGEGTYGIVYKAPKHDNGEVVAVKEIKIDHCDDGIPSTAIREIAVLQELKNNPYIVNLKEIVHGEDRNRLFLIFEYFNKDMKKYLDARKAPLEPQEVKKFMY